MDSDIKNSMRDFRNKIIDLKIWHVVNIFVIMTMLIAGIISVYFYVKVDKVIDKVSSVEIIDFDLYNGQLTAEKLEKEFNLDSEKIFIKINTETIFNEDDFKKNENGILIDSEKMIFKTVEAPAETFLFSDLKLEFSTKEVRDWLNNDAKTLLLLTTLILFLVLSISFKIWKAFDSLFISLIIWIICKIRKQPVNFGAIYKITLVTSSLLLFIVLFGLPYQSWIMIGLSTLFAMWIVEKKIEDRIADKYIEKFINVEENNLESSISEDNNESSDSSNISLDKKEKDENR